MSLSPPHLMTILKERGIVAKKSLGQNFLLDFNITRRIISHEKSLEDFIVLEIGPGPGGLSWAILEKNPKLLIMIEKDKDFIDHLNNFLSPLKKNIEINNEDATKYDINKISERFPENKIKIIANLPYNISTVLLCKWLNDLKNIDSMTLMFQKEVAKRITASPHCKDYGRLSILCQYLCECKSAYELPASCFTPSPKVDSSVVYFSPRKLTQSDMNLLPFVKKITHTAFLKRRKMIRQSLKGLISDEIFEKCKIDTTLRAENLTIENYKDIAKYLYEKSIIVS